MNPFPNYIPKFNPYQYQGGGISNGIGSHTRVEIKSEPQQQDDTINQLEAHQVKLDKQINDIQLQYNTLIIKIISCNNSKSICIINWCWTK